MSEIRTVLRIHVLCAVVYFCYTFHAHSTVSVNAKKSQLIVLYIIIVLASYGITINDRRYSTLTPNTFEMIATLNTESQIEI